MFESVVSVMLRRFHELCLLGFAAMTILVIATSQSARASFSCKDANGATICQPEDIVANGPKNRMRQSQILFNVNDCLVKEISVSGQADWTPPPYASEINIVIRYECLISQTTLPPTDPQVKLRIQQDVNARYDFACALREFKYFASGFDRFNDGSNSHWDSQGSSRPIPWRNLIYAGSDRRLASLFDIWCK